MLLSMCCSVVEQDYQKVCHEITNKISKCFGSRGHYMYLHNNVATVHSYHYDVGIVHIQLYLSGLEFM